MSTLLMAGFMLYLLVLLMIYLFLADNPLWIVRETVTSGTRIASMYETRMANIVSHDALAAVSFEKDRVYVVSAGDVGWRYYECAYQFTPVPVQEGMWSAWPVANKSPAWEDKTSVEYSPKAWSDMLVEGGFTHVYLDKIDERLIEDYHMLFEDPAQIRNGGMYRVETGTEGVRFCAVE